MGDLDNIHYQTLPRGRGGRGGGEEQFNNLRRFSPEAGEQRERVWNPIRIPFTSINPAPSSSGFPPPLPSAGHVLTHFFQMKEKHGLHLFWKHAQGTQTRSCFRSPRHGFLLPARARTKDKGQSNSNVTRWKQGSHNPDKHHPNTVGFLLQRAHNFHSHTSFSDPAIFSNNADTLTPTLVKQVVSSSWKTTLNTNKTKHSRCSPPLEDFPIHHSRVQEI